MKKELHLLGELLQGDYMLNNKVLKIFKFLEILALLQMKTCIILRLNLNGFLYYQIKVDFFYFLVIKNS